MTVESRKKIAAGGIGVGGGRYGEEKDNAEAQRTLRFAEKPERGRSGRPGKLGRSGAAPLHMIAYLAPALRM